jgi:hypothetical protein
VENLIFKILPNQMDKVNELKNKQIGRKVRVIFQADFSEAFAAYGI